MIGCEQCGLADIRVNSRDYPTRNLFSLPEEIRWTLLLTDVTRFTKNLKMTVATANHSGKDLVYGEVRYKAHSNKRHGKQGEGQRNKAYPLIQGQYYYYLLCQLIWIHKRKRRNMNQQMIAAVLGFNRQNLMALSDDISQHPPCEGKRSSLTLEDANSARAARACNP
jgi:cytochrome c553